LYYKANSLAFYTIQINSLSARHVLDDYRNKDLLSLIALLADYSMLDVIVVGNGVDRVLTDFETTLAKTKYPELSIRLRYVLVLDYRLMPLELGAIRRGATG
jgi:hypothetical protein